MAKPDSLKDERDSTMASRSSNDLALAQVLEGYDDTYLHCRGIQHVWHILSDMHVTEKLAGRGELVERHLQCANCDTIRKDRFLMKVDRSKIYRLKVLGAVYKYPDHYLLHEMALSASPREILRHEQLRRLIARAYPQGQDATA